MKRISMTALALVLAASPAMAMKITNLDNVTHTVQLTGNGDPQSYTIEPNATEVITGASMGFLAVADPLPAGKKKPVRKAEPDSTIHADGMLSGVIGTARNNNIPAETDYSYVIWPGGQLAIQSRIRRGGALF